MSSVAGTGIPFRKSSKPLFRNIQFLLSINLIVLLGSSDFMCLSRTRSLYLHKTRQVHENNTTQTSIWSLNSTQLDRELRTQVSDTSKSAS